MSEEIEKMLELAKPTTIEMPGTDKDVSRRCSRGATTSLWAGSIGLALALLAFALAFARAERKWEHGDDMMVIAWLLGIVAWAATMVSSLVGLIRIACSRGKRWGYGRALLGLGLGLLTGAGLLMWACGMISSMFRW